METAVPHVLPPRGRPGRRFRNLTRPRHRGAPDVGRPWRRPGLLAALRAVRNPTLRVRGRPGGAARRVGAERRSPTPLYIATRRSKTATRRQNFFGRAGGAATRRQPGAATRHVVAKRAQPGALCNPTAPRVNLAMAISPAYSSHGRHGGDPDVAAVICSVVRADLPPFKQS